MFVLDIVLTHPAAGATKTVCLVCDRSTTPHRYFVWGITNRTGDVWLVPPACTTEAAGLELLALTVRKLSGTA